MVKGVSNVYKDYRHKKSEKVCVASVQTKCQINYFFVFTGEPKLHHLIG